ncbi:MAG: flagellin [Opitutales bacterium]
MAFEVNAAQRDTERNLRKLSSGNRILRPEDDSGAMQVAMKLDSSRKRSDAALLGLQNARSYTEAQDHALGVVGQLFTRLSELATLAMDPTKNASDRSGYDYEFQNLVKEIQRIDLQEFNDIRLFRGTTYKLFDVGAAIKWTDAKAAVDTQDAADPLNYHYLATITSQSEQDEIARQIGDVGINAWLGGQDTAVEGDWRWTEGPEGKENGGQGRQFWTGTSGGSAVGGAYENWGAGEPNNAGDEDYLQISQASDPAGSWNDLPDRDNMGAGYQPRGYVRETEEGNLPIAYHENGSTYGLSKISYTSGRKGDALYLPNEVFSSMNVKTVTDAVRAVELITGKNQQPQTDEDRFSALAVVANLRAQVGANLSRLGSEIDHLTRKRNNFEAALSRTADLDVSLESTRYRKNAVKLEFGAAMLAQANGLAQYSSVSNFI